jgi:hypothetical protein
MFAEKLAAEILAPVPQHHWTFLIRALSGSAYAERAIANPNSGRLNHYFVFG